MKEDDNNIGPEQIIQSMDGALRAQPPVGMFYKIEQRLKEGYGIITIIPLRTVSLAAASILLLLAINIIIAITSHERQDKADNVQQLAEYYGLTDNYGI